MPVLLVIVFVLLAAALIGGPIGLAIWLSKKNVQVWRTWADSHAGQYKPKQGFGTVPEMNLTRDLVPIRIFIFVGSAVVAGRPKIYNCLRASTAYEGPEFAHLYMPSLQPAPIYGGPESEAMTKWLADVDDLVRARPGLTVECNGVELSVDLPRRTALDHHDDFELMTALLAKLKLTAPATASH
jgi:hypothetical protein